MRYKQNPWIKQLAWLLDGTTASISLSLDSDTDRHGFDQHTDEELRKIVEEAARAAQAVTEGAKPACLADGGGGDGCPTKTVASRLQMSIDGGGRHSDKRSFPWM